uniref:Uncharacterized protein n=1 Tax=Strongyloides venezuelensis TaxID=75913 RepID=A0A0K0G2B6_STRVS
MVSINYEPLHHAERRGIRHGGFSQAKLFFLLCIICAFGIVLYSYFNLSSEIVIMKEIIEGKNVRIQKAINQIEDLHVELESIKTKVESLNKEKESVVNDLRNCKLSSDNERKILLGDVAKEKDQMKVQFNEEKDKNAKLLEVIEKLKKDIEEKVCSADNKKNESDKNVEQGILSPVGQESLVKNAKGPLQIPDLEDSLGGIDGKEKLNPGAGEALVPKDNEEINIPEPNGNEAAPGPGIAIPNQENEGFIANDNLPVKDV